MFLEFNQYRSGVSEWQRRLRDIALTPTPLGSMEQSAIETVVRREYSILRRLRVDPGRYSTVQSEAVNEVVMYNRYSKLL